MRNNRLSMLLWACLILQAGTGALSADTEIDKDVEEFFKEYGVTSVPPKFFVSDNRNPWDGSLHPKPPEIELFDHSMLDPTIKRDANLYYIENSHRLVLEKEPQRRLYQRVLQEHTVCGKEVPDDLPVMMMFKAIAKGFGEDGLKRIVLHQPGSTVDFKGDRGDYAPESGRLSALFNIAMRSMRVPDPSRVHRMRPQCLVTEASLMRLLVERFGVDINTPAPFSGLSILEEFEHEADRLQHKYYERLYLDDERLKHEIWWAMYRKHIWKIEKEGNTTIQKTASDELYIKVNKYMKKHQVYLWSHGIYYWDSRKDRENEYLRETHLMNARSFKLDLPKVLKNLQALGARYPAQRKYHPVSTREDFTGLFRP